MVREIQSLPKKAVMAVFSTKDYDEAWFKRYAPEKLELHFIKDAISVAGIRSGFDYVCVFVNDTVDKQVIDELIAKKVKGILNRCAGFDRVDVRYALKVGMPVCRVPAYSPYAVAEHAVALLQATNRRLKPAVVRCNIGNFDVSGLVGMDLYGKTVGVIGTGRIGQIFIDIMIGFGCKIAAFDVYPNAMYGAKEEVTYMKLDEVYACSDVISLHSPLLPSTKHMICKASIAKMKDGVIILNVSRGGLIKHDDLLDGLASNKIRGVGIDVYENEADFFFKDCSVSDTMLTDPVLARLCGSNRVVMTAHQAFLTDEALGAIAQTTMKNVYQLVSGETPDNRIKESDIMN